MRSKAQIEADIANQQQEHDRMMSSHRTLMDVHKQSGADEVKRRASHALDEAGKRLTRIEELKRELAEVDKGST